MRDSLGPRPARRPPRAPSAACRPSPSAASTRWATASSSAVAPSAVEPRCTSAATAHRVELGRRNSVERDSSGGLTSKYGFSVVAPISTSRPDSTDGSRASCWALLKRCTSSRNRIVPVHRARPRRCSAPPITSRTSFTVAVTADSCDERLAPCCADQPGDRGLAGARRTPEDDRRQPVGLDRAPAAAGPDRAGGPARRPRRACCGRSRSASGARSAS